MKRIIQTVVTLSLTLVMLLGLATPAQAAGTVTYNGKAKEFIFAPGSKYSPTDLFSEFKNVYPGDELTQTITVKNDPAGKIKVKIYMRSLGAEKGSEDFLSKLHLTVAKSKSNKMGYMFDAAANETAGLTDWVLLGTLYSGGTVDLDLTLDVPPELDNKYQNAIGYLDWQFMIVEYPAEPGDPTAPKTGDTAQIYLAACVLVTSAAALVILLVAGKKKKA